MITIQTFTAESLPWHPLKVVLHLPRFISGSWWVTGETAFRLVWLVLASWRGRSIARDGIILVVMLFVIFEKVWMNVSDVYDLHIWRDVSELK